MPSTTKHKESKIILKITHSYNTRKYIWLFFYLNISVCVRFSGVNVAMKPGGQWLTDEPEEIQCVA